MKKLLFLYSIGAFALIPWSSQAATFFVNANTGNDANNCTSAATPCLTIEAALTLADATAEDDTINLAAGTYNTSSTDTVADINSNVSIVGASTQNTFIDGGASLRGVAVNSSTTAGTTASLSNLTIQNGFDSGSGAEGTGIRNNGNLTLDQVVVQNNNTSDGDGGGIFTGRAAPDPAALLVITNSTISGNRSNGRGGGISNGGRGIGDPDYAGTLIMVNSTVSGNTSGVNPDGESAGGGIYNHSNSTVTLFNVTVADNTANSTSGLGGTTNGGGGVFNNSGTFNVNNSLVADNNDASVVNADDCFGALSSTQGYNLVENMSGCTLGGTIVGNITGADPVLATLANNGGATSTQALLAHSPAIDAGNPSGCLDNNGTAMTKDQRGSVRPVAGISGGTAICDIGAFEAAAGTTPSGGGGGGGCSLTLDGGKPLTGFSLVALPLIALWFWRQQRVRG